MQTKAQSYKGQHQKIKKDQLFDLKHMTPPIKTGLLCGTFDPLHNGHLSIANYACDGRGLDEVWLVVSPQSPGKMNRSITNEYLRLEMVQQFLEGNSRIKCCDIEFDLPRPSFLINSVLALKEAFPTREFVLLLGSDQWIHFHKWYKSNEILNEVLVWIYPRTGYEINGLKKHENVKQLNAPLMDISSTSIRIALAKGENVRECMPSAEYEYIINNKIYS